MRSVLFALIIFLTTLVTPAPTGANTQERKIDVGLGEWAVTLESETIRPGPVTFTIHNNGVRAHGLRIRARSQDGRKLRGRDRMRVRTTLIKPGGNAQLHVNLMNGMYRVDCFVEDNAGDHSDMGMKTTLTVSNSAPPFEQKHPATSLNEINIERFAFSPKTLTVEAGSTIKWSNRDPSDHSVTHEERRKFFANL